MRDGERRGVWVGIGLLALMAGLVGPLAKDGRRPVVLRTDDVFVPSHPGAYVPRPAASKMAAPPVCTATALTGTATAAYRTNPRDAWDTLDFGLCQPPEYQPGGVGLLLRGPSGAVLEAVIPVGDWLPHQYRRDAAAQLGLALQKDLAWKARGAALPCQIRTTLLRRFFVSVTSYQGDLRNGRALVGAAVRASFECSGLPPVEGRREPLEFRGELMVRNCEGNKFVVPPPTAPPTCPDA